VDVYDWDFEKYLRQRREEILGLRDLTVKLKLSHTPSLVDELADALRRTLERIDQLPRTDPFWEGRNHLPTVYKLHDHYQAMVTRGDIDVDLALAELAGAGFGGRVLARNVIWKTEVGRRFPIEWFLEASWIQYSNCGPEQSMMAIARELGRDIELRPLLERLAQSDDQLVQSWAQYELAS